MADKDRISPAEKLYDKLSKKDSYPELSKKEMEQLLCHPLIAPYVEYTNHSGGSHFCVVHIRSDILRLATGKTTFCVASHNGICKKYYVKDVMKFIELRKQEIELESDDGN